MGNISTFYLHSSCYLKVGLSPSKKVDLICFIKNPLKMMNYVFYLMLFTLLKYNHFWPEFFGYIEKRLDNKDKEDFKIYDVTNWNINNCKNRIARYLKK